MYIAAKEEEGNFINLFFLSDFFAALPAVVQLCIPPFF